MRCQYYYKNHVLSIMRFEDITTFIHDEIDHAKITSLVMHENKGYRHIIQPIWFMRNSTFQLLLT